MSSIVIDPNVLGFIPSFSAGQDRDSQPPEMESSINIDRIRQEVRAEMEAEFQARMQQEIEQHLAAQRDHFDRSLQQCVTSFDGTITSLKKEIQTNVVNLSIRLAEVIVRHELPDRDMLHNLIVKTLEPVSDLQGATVRLSSHDWQLFGEQMAAGDHLGVGSTVQFAEDPNLDAGDVIVESRNGIFDARLQERLKLLKEALHERSGGTVPKST